ANHQRENRINKAGSIPANESILYVNSTHIAESVLVFVYPPPLSFIYSFELAIKKTPQDSSSWVSFLFESLFITDQPSISPCSSIKAINCSSLITGTPSFSALSSSEPAFSPATTPVALLDTLPLTRAPKACSNCVASSRPIELKVPVTTQLSPFSGWRVGAIGASQ